ncbi:MAG: tetratricopeptide repeat protein [Isosphaeraceae bacterium]
MADGLNSLAVSKMKLGKVDEAIPLYEEGIAIIRRLMGEVHPELAVKLGEPRERVVSQEGLREGDRPAESGGRDAGRDLRRGTLPGARTRFNLAVVVSTGR